MILSEIPWQEKPAGTKDLLREKWIRQTPSLMYIFWHFWPPFPKIGQNFIKFSGHTVCKVQFFLMFKFLEEPKFVKLIIRLIGGGIALFIQKA
jgi:hypothetical protein